MKGRFDGFFKMLGVLFFTCVCVRILMFFFIMCFNVDKWPFYGKICFIIGLVAIFFIVLFFITNLLQTSKKNAPVKNVYELEREGLLQHEYFCALRAFKIEDVEDFGPQFFIELEDKRVLYLNGQYLDDYDPYVPLGETPATERKFPCSGFEILRHHVSKEALKINCHGTLLARDSIKLEWDDWGSGYEDGDIITDRTYDEIKVEKVKKAIRHIQQ